MRRGESPAGLRIKGQIAGLVGTLVMSYILQLVMPRRVQPVPREAEPAVSENLAGRLSKALFHNDMSPEQQRTWGSILRWTCGA